MAQRERGKIGKEYSDGPVTGSCWEWVDYSKGREGLLVIEKNQL